MNRTIIIAGGTLEDYSWYKSFLHQDDLIICADHGLDHAKNLGIIPHLIVGDFDSANRDNLNFFCNKGVICKSYKCDKDLTDTQIALQFALEKKTEEIIFLAVLGDRLDHSWSNVLLLVSLLEKDISAKIVTSTSEISVLSPKYKNIYGNKGDIISLLPITPVVKQITTSGLSYSLTKEDLFITNPYAVSNILLENAATVSIAEGILLVVRNYGGQ